MNLSTIPRWRLYVYGAIVILAISYFAWCKWGTRAAKPGETSISAPPAKAIASMETKTVYITKVVTIKDKVEAVAKLGLPPSEASNPKEELLTATDVKANKHGATVVTFLNVTTGQPRTDIRYKPSPWFSFERGTVIGMGAGINSGDGYVGKVYVRRDIAQIKGTYILIDAEGIARPNSADQKGELLGTVNIERRFDWP